MVLYTLNNIVVYFFNGNSLIPFFLYFALTIMRILRAKKVVSDSLGLVDIAIGLVNPVLNLPNGQAKIFRRIKIIKVL